jgi:parvulin-like peptidyl-prolyl isomerase
MKKMKKRIVLSLLLSTMLLATQFAYGVMPVSPAEPNQPPKPELPKDGNFVVATCQGKNLTLREVGYFAPNADFDTAKNVADFWINTQLLYEEAMKKAIDKDEKTKLMADIAFKKAIASAYIEQVQGEVKVSDAEVKKYYDENKDTDPRLKEPAYISFSHITVDTPEKAKAIIEQLNKGAEINELAKTESVAADAKKGGKAVKFREESVLQRYGKEFADALNNATEGQIIGPVKNKEGKYEVARHEGKRASYILPFDKTKDQIKSTLENEKKKNAVQDLLKNIQEKSKDKCKKADIFNESEKSEKAVEKEKNSGK